jgi:hypothetical protein
LIWVKEVRGGTSREHNLISAWAKPLRERSRRTRRVHCAWATCQAPPLSATLATLSHLCRGSGSGIVVAIKWPQSSWPLPFSERHVEIRVSGHPVLIQHKLKFCETRQTAAVHAVLSPDPTLTVHTGTYRTPCVHLCVRLHAGTRRPLRSKGSPWQSERQYCRP